LFPARVEKRRYGVSLPILFGWTHPFAPLGVPLVEREAAEPVIAAWLAHLAADATLPGTVLLPFLTEQGPFATTLDAIARRAQMPVADFDRHRRALLAPAGERARYLERAIGRHRLKEIRRQWRRLGETGAVLFTTASKRGAVATAVEDFLVLEAGGWKGRAGTAAAQHQELCRFMRTAMPALADESKVTVDRILVDGRTIAATIMLRSGRCAWFWKIAYDETFARFSPGVMLSAVLTNELAEDTTLVQTDSCATADHPMIDHLWRERLALCNRLIAVRPHLPFSLLRRLEALRSTAIAAAKGVRDNIRRRFRR
jgi:CelD/BcsL family acetyltransferase involved in cellulose biosynthesis